LRERVREIDRYRERVIERVSERDRKRERGREREREKKKDRQTKREKKREKKKDRQRKVEGEVRMPLIPSTHKTTTHKLVEEQKSNQAHLLTPPTPVPAHKFPPKQ
jgi:hypothetical protein